MDGRSSARSDGRAALVGGAGRVGKRKWGIAKMSSERLVRALREGKPEAIVELRDLLERRLLPYVRRKTSGKLAPRLDADDVVQETVVELYLRVRRADQPIRDLEAFARGIARNVIAAAAQRRSVGFGRLDRSWPAGDPIGADSATASRWAMATERHALVRNALSTLSPNEVRIIELRFFSSSPKKLTFEDIGRLIGKSASATEKAYLRSKSKLRDYFRRHRLTRSDSRH